MNQSPNDLYANVQNNLYPLKDFRPIVAPDTTNGKPYNPYPHPLMYNITSTFVADWQLPGVEYHEINKSNT